MKELNSAPQYLKHWAQKIKQAGLSTPAILALETHKPLSFVFSQLLLVGQPMLNLFLPRQITGDAVELFSNRQRLDSFISELEKK